MTVNASKSAHLRPVGARGHENRSILVTLPLNTKRRGLQLNLIIQPQIKLQITSD